MLQPTRHPIAFSRDWKIDWRLAWLISLSESIWISKLCRSEKRKSHKLGQAFKACARKCRRNLLLSGHSLDVTCHIVRVLVAVAVIPHGSSQPVAQAPLPRRITRTAHHFICWECRYVLVDCEAFPHRNPLTHVFRSWSSLQCVVLCTSDYQLWRKSSHLKNLLVVSLRGISSVFLLPCGWRGVQCCAFF
jgi:hypothetical protein